MLQVSIENIMIWMKIKTFSSEKYSSLRENVMEEMEITAAGLQQVKLLILSI